MDEGILDITTAIFRDYRANSIGRLPIETATAKPLGNLLKVFIRIWTTVKAK